MTIQIRRYQDSDREQVLRLHKVALAAVGADAGPGPWDDDLHQIEQTYLTARGEFLVGILDTSDRQAAAIALYRTEGYLETGRGELAGLPTLFFRKTLAPATIESALADAMDDRPGTAISG